MKEEVEFKLIVCLLNSRFVKGLFKKPGGCKKDFEKVCSVNEKNYEFRKWLDDLIRHGCLEFVQTIKYRGGKVDTYLVNKKFMEEKLKLNPIYNPTIRYFENNKFLIRTAK